MKTVNYYNPKVLPRTYGYVSKEQKIRKFLGAVLISAVIVTILSIANLLTVINTLHSVEMKNLQVYGDINGFKPVH